MSLSRGAINAAFAIGGDWDEDPSITDRIYFPGEGEEEWVRGEMVAVAGLGRSLIDGVMVIYDPDDMPAWLRAVVRARDEDGNTTDATDRLDVRDARSRRAAVEDGAIVMTFREGTAITGVLA